MIVTVEVTDKLRGEHGNYDHNKTHIKIARGTEQQMVSTFLHEWAHCFAQSCGYDKLNADEQFIELLGQCLYQLLKEDPFHDRQE